MSKLIVVIASVMFVAGCGDDPHSAGDCDSAWRANGVTECELACENSRTALGASGPSCDGTTVDNIGVSCSQTFEYDGIRGCCTRDGNEMHFAECD